jgi:glycosyltransferase involved in cell wall biosynthesis
MKLELTIVCCWLGNDLSACERSLSSLKALPIVEELEIVVIDSSQTDDLERLFTGFIGARLFRYPPSSIYNAFNLGVSKSTKAFFMFLHEGDELDPTLDYRLFRTLLQRTLIPSTGLIAFGYKIEVFSGLFYHRKSDVRFPFLGEFPLHVGTICNRKLWEALRGFDESFKVSGDYDFFLRSLDCGFSMAVSELSLGRMVAGGASRKKLTIGLKEDARALRARYGYFFFIPLSLKKFRFLFWSLKSRVDFYFSEVVKTGR